MHGMVYLSGISTPMALVLNARLEKVALEPKRIPFVEKRLAETRKTQTDIHGMETKDTLGMVTVTVDKPFNAVRARTTLF